MSSPAPHPATAPFTVAWSGPFDARVGTSITTSGSFVAWGAPGHENAPFFCEDCAHAVVGVAPLPITGPWSSDETELRARHEEHDFAGNIGGAVLLPGDVTGDGEDDLVAFEEPPSDEWPNGAGAWLLPGPLARRGDSTLQTDALPLAWPSGPWRGTPCGDVNADGIADLCLATGIDLGPVTAGSTPDVTWSAADPAEARVDGGLRVERADLDGDGGVELLLWNPVASAVHRLTAFPAGDHDPAALAASTWTAAPGVGTALAASGDLTGDGAEDFVVGWTDGAAPHVYVASGTAGGLLEDGHATIELPAAALAVGDFDADGHDDLAVGGDGTVRIFRGPLPAGSVDADTAAAWWMGQEYPTDRFGDALAAGDVDGDGRDDLLVGAPSSGVAEEVSPQPNGAVYVLSGGDL